MAGFLPVAVALGAFVIDIGNAMEHDRHLQVKADAGALAAAQEFNTCRTNPTDANAAIAAAATNYANDRNVLVDDDEAQGRVNTVINGTDYDAADNSLGTPCETGFVDVKLTEEDSPAFFDFVGNHDYRGHTRIQFQGAAAERLAPGGPAGSGFRERGRDIRQRGDRPAPAGRRPRRGPQLPKTGNGTFESPTAGRADPSRRYECRGRIALSNDTSTSSCAAADVCYDAGDANKGLVSHPGLDGGGERYLQRLRRTSDRAARPQCHAPARHELRQPVLLVCDGVLPLGQGAGGRRLRAGCRP